MSTSLHSPFVGLIPYDADSRRYFCGRDKEIDLVTAAATATRLSIVYGPSGGGKSSVLCAGVIPNLEEQTQLIDDDDSEATPDVPDRIVVLIRQQWSADPFAAISSAIHKICPQLPFPNAWFTPPTGAPTTRVPQLILVLDQFEDLFIQHPVINSTSPAMMLDLARRMRAGETLDITSSGLRVAISLIALLNDPAAPVNVIFSLREDLLASLDVFKGLLPNLFNTLLRIELMNGEIVRGIITTSLQRWTKDHPAQPCQPQPELIDSILADTALHQREPVRNTETGPRFETPFLALTLERLWNEDIGKAKGSQLTLVTYTRLKQASGIRQSFVQDTLNDHLRSPADKSWFVEAARFLVSRTQKFPWIASELVREIDEPLTAAGIAPPSTAQLVTLLRTFLPDHLVRELPLPDKTDAADGKFEIAHDALAGDIYSWRAGQIATLRQQEQIAEAEAARAEQLKEAERKRIKAIRATATSAAIGFICFACAIWMLFMWSKADSAKKDAIAANKEAVDQKGKAEAANAGLVEQTKLANAERDKADKAATEAKNAEARALAANAEAKRFAKKSASDAFTATIQGTLIQRVTAAFALAKKDDLSEFFRIRNDIEDTLETLDAIDYTYLDDLTRRREKVENAQRELRKSVAEIKAKIGQMKKQQFIADAPPRQLKLTAHRSVVRNASFGPAGTPAADLFVSAGYGTTKSLQLTGIGSAARVPPGRLTVFSDAQFSPDGTEFAAAGEDGTVHRFDTGTLAALPSLPAHGKDPVLCVAYGPDHLLASAGSDWRVVIRNWKDSAIPEQVIQDLGGAPTHIGFNHQNAEKVRLLIACADGRLLICKPGNPLAIARIDLPATITSASFSARDKWIVATAGTITYLINPDSPEIKPLAIPISAAGESDGENEIDSNRLNVRFAAISPDEKTLAICAEDGITRTLRLASITATPPGDDLKYLPVHSAAVHYAAWSPDSRYLATAGDDDIAAIWDTQPEQPVLVARLVGHAHRLLQINWHSSGQYLVTASQDDTARLWKFEPKN